METEQDKFIREKNASYAQNIDEFKIGQIVYDRGYASEILDKTANTIQVFICAKNKKGINSKEWFDMTEFNKRFKISK
jgi:hypothetical protein